MKQHLSLLSLLLASSLCANAQWVTNGVNISNSNTGNVGVGTTSPGARLHISTIMNPGNITELLRLEQRGNNGNELGGEGSAIAFYTPVSPSPDVIGAQIYSFRENSVNLSPTTALRFSTNNAGVMADRLIISGTGNVGIGTTDNATWNLAASTYKLAVGGSMISTSVTVKLVASWPDYVFKAGYNRPTLTEVKTYIDQNHHLPEIPSEQEVLKDGLNLGDMNRLLLKKVEELTLYLIEQDKASKEQKLINEKNKLEIKQLQKQMKRLVRLTPPNKSH